MNDLLDGEYYWSTTAKNETQGVTGPAGNLVVWDGPSTSTFQQFEINNAYSTGNVIDFSPAFDHLIPGGTLRLIATDSGDLLADTYIQQINSNVQFEMNQAPGNAISNGVMTISGTYSNVDIGSGGDSGNVIGGVTGNTIANDSIGFDQAAGNIFGRELAYYAYTVSSLTPGPSGTDTQPVNWNTTIGTQGSLLSTNFAQPKYITRNSTVISSSAYHAPWWNGVASVAFGFSATSTAPTQPPYSSQWNRGSNQTLGGGASPVWPIEFAEMTYEGRRFIAEPNNVIKQRYAAIMIPDQDCFVQIDNFGHFVTAPNWRMTARDNTTSISVLYANVPNSISIETGLSGISNAIDGFGIFLRILTPGTTVTITTASYVLNDTKDDRTAT
jgi:hypothetical protein